MATIKDNINALLDKTTDPVILENVFRYLTSSLDRNVKSLSDELSEADLQSLHEAQAEYRTGKTKTHEEILELLRK